MSGLSTEGCGLNGPFAAKGHIHHAGEQAMQWGIQNKENSRLTG